MATIDPLGDYLKQLSETTGSGGGGGGSGSPSTDPNDIIAVSTVVAPVVSSTVTGSTLQTTDGKPTRVVTLPDGTSIIVADNPNYKAPPPPPPPDPYAPTGLDKTLTDVSKYLGYANTAMMVGTMAKILPNVSKAAAAAAKAGTAVSSSIQALGKLQKGLGIAGIVMAGYQAFSAIDKMFENGFSWKSMGQVGMAYLSAFMGYMQLGFPAPIAAAAALGVMVYATIAAGVKRIISLLFGSHDKPANLGELAVTTPPPAFISGNNMAVMMIGALVHSSAIGFVPTTPKVTRNVAYRTVQSNLIGYQLQRVSGDVDPSQFNKAAYYRANHYTPVYVGKDQKSILMVSPYDSVYDQTTVYSFRNGFTFTNPTAEDPVYTPITVRDPSHPNQNMINPTLYKSLQASKSMAAAAPYLAGSAPTTAVREGGTLNKEGEAQ